MLSASDIEERDGLARTVMGDPRATKREMSLASIIGVLISELRRLGAAEPLAIFLGRPDARIQTERLRAFVDRVLAADPRKTVMAPQDPKDAGLLADAVQFAPGLGSEVIRLRGLVTRIGTMRSREEPPCVCGTEVHLPSCPWPDLEAAAEAIRDLDQRLA
jgi:hypothetical protein